VNLWAGNTEREGVALIRTLVRGIDLRSRTIETLDEIERTSIDYYATIRSLYRQTREDEIRNGDLAPLPELGAD
jgi:phospholipid-binding lipoprotein MlaA